MTFGASALSAPSRRAILGLLVSAFGLAACVTLLWLGMRAVMAVGGACADGGPYVSVQPCPDGVAMSMMLGIFGLFGFGGLGLWAGALIGGSWMFLPLLAWPGLFLSLGWNFLELGATPPAGLGEGPELGWLIPGVMFVVMGGLPLVVAWRAPGVVRSGRAQLGARQGTPLFGSARLSAPPAGPAQEREPLPRPDGAPVPPADVVDRIERLADLRRRGDLTSEEFELAKRHVLGSPSDGPEPGR